MLAGVDPSLVSRVVNDDPKAALLPQTRERILSAVQQLGYQANPSARGLRMARTWTIGLILPNLYNPLYAAIVEGAKTRARELGYGLLIDTHEEQGEQSTFTSMVIQGRVDGLLTASGVLGDAFMRQVAESHGSPVVLVNRRIRGHAASVTMDDDAGVRLAVSHLVDAGHRSVVGLFGPGNLDTAQRRRTSFIEACREAGITGDAVNHDEWDYESGYRAGLAALTASTSYTAVFAASFVIGVGVLRAARELSRSVPDDLSVIALHDSPLADFLTPAMTTVSMPTHQMARQAVDLLVARIEGGKGKHLVVKDRPFLVARESTGPVPAN